MGAILEWIARHTLSVPYRGRLLEDDAGGSPGGACATSVADSWESTSPSFLLLFFSSSSYLQLLIYYLTIPHHQRPREISVLDGPFVFAHAV